VAQPDNDRGQQLEPFTLLVCNQDTEMLNLTHRHSPSLGSPSSASRRSGIVSTSLAFVPNGGKLYALRPATPPRRCQASRGDSIGRPCHKITPRRIGQKSHRRPKNGRRQTRFRGDRMPAPSHARARAGEAARRAPASRANQQHPWQQHPRRERSRTPNPNSRSPSTRTVAAQS
jgi:hypothetical protein